MKTPLMLAAVLLTLGMGSANAGTAAAPVPTTEKSVQADRPANTQQASGQQLTFPLSHRHTVSVYSQFNGGAYPDGGEN
jgi:hypothetical protein